MPSFPTPIEHIVVLMMENRSFDHMLGALKQYGMPELEGLSKDLSNPFPGQPPTKVFFGPQGSEIYQTNPDPGHEFPQVTVQLYGSASWIDDKEPTNTGFIQSYAQMMDKGTAIGFERAKEVMRHFRPEQVPIISKLARNFIICERWFSSVPGSTWPNRFFVQCATSNGDLITPGFKNLDEVLWHFQTYEMKTIYETLDDAGLTWNVYHHDTPQVLMLANIRESLQKFSKNFKSLDAFLEDAKAGNLAHYVFIEPRHIPILHQVMANNQHAPYDVRAGERLIAEVYNALRGNKELWEKSILIILYDEHGGFYDHVPPLRTISPDDKFSIDPPFKFDRLGVRVPALIISPYLIRDKHIDPKEHYDHTSLLATVYKLFNIQGPPLTLRDAKARTFEDNFDFSSPPKPDCLLPFTESDFVDVGQPEERFSVASIEDLTEYQVMLLLMAKHLSHADEFEHLKKAVSMAEKFLGFNAA